jgi:arylsulfatase A-like enzyme
MNRRDFLGLAGASALASQIARRIEAQEAPAGLRFINRKAGAHPFRTGPTGKRPNIFLITIDMVSPDHWHPSRSLWREMDLPAIRSLAADGTAFHNAFCASPLCAPARAALATGRYTYITANGERAHDGHETILRPSDVIFQEYLKATGYKTKHVGKGHLGTQKFMDAFDENDNAWDRWAPPIHDDELYLTDLRRLGVKPQRYGKEIRGMQQDRRTPYASLGGWIEQSDGKPFPIEAQYSHHLARRAIDKLDAALGVGSQSAIRPPRRTKSEIPSTEPIYLQIDFFDPHQPFSIPGGLQQRQKQLRAAFALPDSYEKVRARDWRPAPGEPKIYGFYRKAWGLYDPETVRDYRVANALQMEVVDRAIGTFIRALKERGLYDESLIVFTADHGEMNGRRAVVDKGVYLFPDVLRVPLVIKPPASWSLRPHTVDQPVCHLDIAPTLLAVTGIEPEERLDGRSLIPHLQGKPPAEDRDLLFECGWHTGVNFACGTQARERDGRHFLYTYNLSSDIDELYDLNAVDAENLAANPEYAAQHKQMAARLGAFLEKDPRWIGYWHSFRIDHYFDLPRPAGDPQMFRPI